jgi:hypothetical protein
MPSREGRGLASHAKVYTDPRLGANGIAGGRTNMRSNRSESRKRRLIAAMAVLLGAAATPINSFAQG